MPHTISFAIMYRARIDSFNQLPKDRRPPRDLWNKPYRLSMFLDKLWDGKEDSSKKDVYEYDEEDVE